MTMIRTLDGLTVWPYSLGQLRHDEPQRSFSNSPSDRELAVFGVFRVVATGQPSYDPAAERVAEIEPIAQDGQWLQQWEMVPLTEAEAADYYRATHPPRWLEFGAVVVAMSEIKTLLNQGLAAGESPLAMGLAVGLGKAADGDSRMFLNTWQQACAAGLIAPELVTGLQMLAAAHDLPVEFIAGLAV